MNNTIYILHREPKQMTRKAWVPVLLTAISTWLGNSKPANEDIDLGYKKILGSLGSLFECQEDRESLENKALQELQTFAEKRDRADAEVLNAWYRCGFFLVGKKQVSAILVCQVRKAKRGRLEIADLDQEQRLRG